MKCVESRPTTRSQSLQHAGFLGQVSLKHARSIGDAWCMVHLDSHILVYKRMSGHLWRCPCNDSYSPSKKSCNLRLGTDSHNKKHFALKLCAGFAAPYERARAR